MGNTGGTKRDATGRSTEDMNEACRDQGQDRYAAARRSSKGSLAEQNQMAGRLGAKHRWRSREADVQGQEDL